jgi:hypothetical protein
MPVGGTDGGGLGGGHGGGGLGGGLGGGGSGGGAGGGLGGSTVLSSATNAPPVTLEAPTLPPATLKTASESTPSALLTPHAKLVSVAAAPEA